MKQKILFIILAIGAGFIVPAQKAPILKVYAYSQVVLPGARKNNAVEENGTEIKQEAVKKINYFFYAEQKKSAIIKVTAIWIQGEKYTAKTEGKLIIPVEIASAETKKIILMPASENKFILILPGEAATKGLKPSGALKKMIKESELVVAYQWKGKLWYFQVKKIKEIEPVAAV
jgi:hypothetical protein